MNNMQILAPQLNRTIIPHDLMQLYYDIKKENRHRGNWKTISEEELWKELIFCVLSANVSFELVESVVNSLTINNYLNFDWLIQNKKSVKILHQHLSTPNFLPKKKDGTLRKYRYPKRSSYIVNSAKQIYKNNHSLKEILSSTSSDFELRNNLAMMIPGIGLKESSHFLRNVGFSKSLAIIDVHIYDFCRDFLQLNLPGKAIASQKQYIILETILQDFSSYHNLDLAIFDLAVWHYMRQKFR